ncbi:MAG: DUF3426 domain-containing protein [Crenarchaeota archaeon]|nr:MAG: DUF3426 domain-containing protein [Thermoproteota archaeon]RDJ32899.1 MAG: DUF3426 domain-containing protein [Thermoproteota archaeon]RDJ36019.1 MAG: DUF3426 domain-containing protein [Thermoproteota archaeon]RDJ38267.1 MAG: DUF3426 domain-containing protein [Thermoproteota archaeon]
MRYLLFLLPIFLIPNAWADVAIQNDQQYLGIDGSYHIVGEIYNGLDAPITQIEVSSSLYANSELVDTISASSLVNTIMPGMKGPFEILATGKDVAYIDSYLLALDYKVSTPKNQVIDVIDSEILRDAHNNLMIKGTVANKGEITANIVSVVATLYDRSGNVAAVERIHTEPDYLRSNSEAFFLVSVPDKTQSSTVVDYSLIAESEEYAAVPEFPLGTSLLFVSSIIAYVAFTKYPNKFITNLVSAADPK